MTWAEFKRKWARYSGTETSAYQEHFNDLCRMMNHPTPAEADPTGSETFCFQKCADKLKKRALTNLYNERPAWLNLAHKRLDAAVVAAYGWPADLSDGQILEKLLALNLERAAEEEKATGGRKAKAQREKGEHELI